nr:ABC-2 transporter permease [Streptomyces sp. NBC_00899]
MNAVVRMTVLHLRTVAPYRTQGLLVFGLLTLILARNPDHVVPALAVLLAPLIAVHPFVVADKADLRTLYAVLPVPHRTVVLGSYAWAVAGFLGTVGAGAGLAALLARAEGVPLHGSDLVTLLGLSWVLFAVNIGVQFPLLIRFGYARISVLGTVLPLALVMVAVVRLHLSFPTLQHWLPLLCAAGPVVLAASAILAARLPGPRA